MSSLGTGIINKPSNHKFPKTTETADTGILSATDTFLRRHLGPSPGETAEMTRFLNFGSLDALIDAAVPPGIRLRREMNLPVPKGEHEALHELREMGKSNKVFRSFLGRGYHGSITPPVIQRNIMENPGWYTAYTPYQAEIAQGRLEALLNFQTMVVDLTGLDIANASLLDEATAAAEAMTMAFALKKNVRARTIFVSKNCHPQTIEVIQTRAEPLGIHVLTGDEFAFEFNENVFAILLQYPGTQGEIHDYAALVEKTHKTGALVIVAADILSLVLLKPPGDFGADIAIGSTQRFGVPLGYGGPHAAYLATRDAFKRQMPGRLIGVSHDSHGNPACRLALQTREQHIRRDKATSNICTAQVLLAVMASMYAVYHGPEGLKAIARRVHTLARVLAEGLASLGCDIGRNSFFDTVRVQLPPDKLQALLEIAEKHHVNLGVQTNHTVCISVDETTTSEDISTLWKIFNGGKHAELDPEGLASEIQPQESGIANRTSPFLTHPVFNRHHTETGMLRYIRQLEAKDLSLCHSMIPLGSCTMKLNATSQMLPVTWFGYSRLHPHVPAWQAAGYQQVFSDLEKWLAEITGFAGVSLQPNAGSQGEYAGLLAIRKYHESRGEGHRNTCLIPTSAHGTNPASAVMAGFHVVPVQCEGRGDIDLDDLRAKACQHRDDLACLMVTYPSTHGVFEETIGEICGIVHENGGQVYMDGANMNAQVGLCSPGDIGADVCHLNLHKTFCIPHGGGGPGVGPIGVAKHLLPFLPKPGGGGGMVSASPWGSASILVIPWVYIRMMGSAGLTEATKTAILGANYIAARLDPYFPVLFKGKAGLVAHECILDLRHWKTIGIEVEDVAKRLMDYGFHAPTISWPVPGTMMIEPTESESKEELDRFCDAMISIHGEIKEVESGVADRQNNLLKNAPHTAQAVVSDKWEHPYSREAAAYPSPWLKHQKFWPAVGRIDNVYGDRNLVCSCPTVDEYAY
jgi:glycine dehydrogenase